MDDSTSEDVPTENIIKPKKRRDYSYLYDKTIKSIEDDNDHEYDDTGDILITFTDDTRLSISASYGNYTGKSADEYPTRLHVSKLLPALPKDFLSNLPPPRLGGTLMCTLQQHLYNFILNCDDPKIILDFYVALVRDEITTTKQIVENDQYRTTLTTILPSIISRINKDEALLGGEDIVALKNLEIILEDGDLTRRSFLFPNGK